MTWQGVQDLIMKAGSSLTLSDLLVKVGLIDCFELVCRRITSRAPSINS